MARQLGFSNIGSLLNIVLLILLVASLCYVQGEEKGYNLYTHWSHSYPPTTIKPYDWSYNRVELPHRFASWSFRLDTDLKTETKLIIPKRRIHKIPMMCFREGSPPLPDVSETVLNNLAVEQAYNQSLLEAVNIQKCYALQGKMTFTLTNEQVAEGVLYIGFFNGIGPARTQSKMINRGKPYTFSAITSIIACNGSTLWGRHCDKTLHQLQCDNYSDSKPQDTRIRGMITTCEGSFSSCHSDFRPKLFVLNVKELSEELVLTSKNSTLVDQANYSSINKMGHGQVSLMCYARNGAIPTEKVFDYSGDLSKSPFFIKLPKLGTWYLYIMPVHSNDVSRGKATMPRLCHTLHWEVLGCPAGKAGPNCSWERYNIEANEEQPFISANGNKLPAIDLPLETTLSKPLLGPTLDSTWPWTYFHMEIPPNSATRNIRIKLISNSNIAYELYARLGGLPSTNAWDYYYVNQTSNSNNGSFFKLYESNSQNAEFYLVYAREGNWTFGLRKRLAMLDSGSQSNFSMSLESCPKQCSGHGPCLGATDSKSCSFCQCDTFHGGFDCSLELVSGSGKKVQIAFLIASNAAAILPAIWALWQKSYAEWVVFLASGVSSAIYHACDVQWICLLGYHTLQFLDFWLSFVAVISTFVYMAFKSESVKRGILSVAWIITAVMAIGDATSSRNIVLLIVIGAVCLTIALLLELSTSYKSLPNIFHLARVPNIGSCFIELVTKLHQRYRLRFMIVGLIALASAATSWFLEDSENYWFWHSVWHIAIYSAAFFFLISKVKARDNCSKPSRNHDDARVLPMESSHGEIEL